MQIHELNNFNGTPGSTNYLAIDNGSDTSRISGTDLLAPVNARVDNVVLQNKSESVNLFAGNISKGGGTYSLSQSAANFDFLEVVFNFNGQTVQTTRVRPNADVLISVPGFNATDNPPGLDVTRIGLYFNGSNITVYQAYDWAWNGSSDANSSVSPSTAWADQLSLEVYGIRYAQLDSTEVTDLRTAHNGTTYATARAAREADYNALDSEITSKTNDIKGELNTVKVQFPEINGSVLPPSFEIGVRYLNNGVDTFANNVKRLSFKRWEYIKLKAGDQITINRDVIAEFGGGYSADGGSTFIGISGRGSDYTAPADGIYFFWLRKIDSADFTNADIALGGEYILFNRAGSMKEEVEDLQADVNSLITGIEHLYGKFVNGTLESGNLNTYVKYRVATNTIMVYDRNILLHIASGFKIGIQTFVNGSFYSDSGWKTGTYLIPSGTNFKAVIARVTENTSEVADVNTFVNAISFDTTLQTELNKIPSISDRTSVVENLFRFDRYFSHLGVSKTTNIIIPCQSTADVLRSRRLGFKVMELNVHKTSDNKYICLHGDSGKFGAQFIGADQSYVSTISINTKTLSWIKSNVRFKSNYPKYRTAPFTLQEMLIECRRQGIIPLVQYVDTTMVSILDEIMGENNYILNLYTNDRGVLTDAVCCSWTAISDPSAAVAKCNLSGKSYILGVNHAASAFSGFSDTDWQNYINAVHAAGYLISGAYMSAELVRKYFDMGWDILASAAQINEIKDGNLCELYSDVSFSDFSTNGTVSNGTLTLPVNYSVTPRESLPQVFLGGASLHVRFKGKLYIGLGSVGGNYISDGSSDVWLSCFFEEDTPTFEIYALDNSAEIYDISFKASRM